MKIEEGIGSEITLCREEDMKFSYKCKCIP